MAGDCSVKNMTGDLSVNKKNIIGDGLVKYMAGDEIGFQ
jgi:hypothetical protein